MPNEVFHCISRTIGGFKVPIITLILTIKITAIEILVVVH